MKLRVRLVSGEVVLGALRWGERRWGGCVMVIVREVVVGPFLRGGGTQVMDEWIIFLYQIV